MIYFLLNLLIYLLSQNDHVSLLAFVTFDLFFFINFVQTVSLRFSKTRATDLSLFPSRLLEKSIQDQSPTDNDRIYQHWPSQVC